jgi:hypothetical protein
MELYKNMKTYYAQPKPELKRKVIVTCEQKYEMCYWN